jgi:hypothetical protein
MIADGLHATLLSFEPRLRDIRTNPNGLDIEKPAGTQVVGLRDRLLGLSREISNISRGLSAGCSPLPTPAHSIGVLSQLVSRASMSAPRSSSRRTAGALPE